MTIVHFRFYAELNAFLTPLHRQRCFAHACARDASAKHMIEALGVPHTEVELILANDDAVPFSYRLQEEDRVSVYPFFSTLDRHGTVPHSLRLPGPDRFIADAHLGRLARDLRMLGFDVLYSNTFSDAQVARLAVDEQRIVLTRDRDLLIRKSIERGCYLHATTAPQQLDEVMHRYRLAGKMRPLSRCLSCNDALASIDKQQVRHRLPPRSSELHDEFFYCRACDQVYWNGSHAGRMRERVRHLLRTHRPPE